MLETLITSGGLIFDFDGTIADTEPYQAQSYPAILEATGFEDVPGVEFFFEKCKGHTVPDIWQIISKEMGKPLPIDELEQQRTVLLERLLDDNDVKPFEFVWQLLDIFPDKSKAIVSADYQSFIEIMMEKWDILDRFDMIFGFETGCIPKVQRLESLFCEWKPAVLFEDSQKWLDFANENQAIPIAICSSGSVLNASFSINPYEALILQMG